MDDYPKSLWKKLYQFSDKIHDFQKNGQSIDAVLLGGDLFDHPEPSNRIVNQLVELIYDTGVPWKVIAGSHDIYGYNIKTLPRTALGLLHKTGVVDLLVQNIPYIAGSCSDGEVPQVGVWGESYYYGIDGDPGVFDAVWYADGPEPKVKILMLHSIITPNVFPADHIRVKDIRTDFDLVLVGHYHPGFKATKVKRLSKSESKRQLPVVINPSAFGRVERCEYIYDRPGALMIQVKGTKIELSRISLDVAQPNDEIFETMVNVPIIDQAISVFAAEVREIASKVGTVDPKSAFLTVAKKMELEQPVVDTAVEIYDYVQAKERPE